MFRLNADNLRKLWKQNQFIVPDDKWVLFGLRGCLPIDDGNYELADEQAVMLENIDHVHPRCIIGQMTPEGEIAVFPASTVPHRRYISKSVERGGRGANQLMTGAYKDYRKGKHKASSKTGHEAFRQDGSLPIRRTADDIDYDEDDRVEYGVPYDNLHAGWCGGVDHDYFASAGCQVINGYPKCEKRGSTSSDIGPWKYFKENAYAISQKSFYYILLNGRDAMRVTNNARLTPRLRFGSQGELVKTVQKSLREKELYEGRLDGDFGKRSLFAVLNFQTEQFGPSADDGIVGPMTAGALGVDWPGDID